MGVFPSSTLFQGVHESHAVSTDSVPTPLCPSLGLGNSDSEEFQGILEAEVYVSVAPDYKVKVT